MVENRNFWIKGYLPSGNFSGLLFCRIMGYDKCQGLLHKGAQGVLIIFVPVKRSFLNGLKGW